jgi:hypothetical protein
MSAPLTASDASFIGIFGGNIPAGSAACDSANRKSKIENRKF